MIGKGILIFKNNYHVVVHDLKANDIISQTSKTWNQNLLIELIGEEDANIIMKSVPFQNLHKDRMIWGPNKKMSVYSSINV